MTIIGIIVFLTLQLAYAVGNLIPNLYVIPADTCYCRYSYCRYSTTSHAQYA